MRFALAASTALIAAGVAHAETATIYISAPGQEVLSLERYQSALPGAKALDLDVGIGSALFRDPSGANAYYSVSDRGPNFTCEEGADMIGVKAEELCPEVEGQKAGAGRVYPTPAYNVSIYQVTLDPAAHTFAVTNVIPLKTPKGNPILGLTNPLTVAKTDKPRDGAGAPLKQDANAIDAEGLVRLADGRFFIGEENATGIVEVSADGVIVRRFVPAGTDGDFAAADYPVSGSLPAIYAMRNSNRGIESLSISDDGKSLYALVQNPLANPDAKAYGDAVNARLLKLDIGKGADGETTLTPTAEYVYQLDDWQNFKTAGSTDASKASSLRISEMTALGHDHFLVDERTDQVAKLFEISLDGATNILGSPWDDAATSPSLEQSELAAASITPVTKTERLVASSLEGAATRYPAKIEGISLTSDGKLILINDNDFGITGAATQMVIVEGTEIGAR